MLYEFTGSGRIETAGIKAINVIAFGRQAITAGTKITLSWGNNKVYTMTASDNPTQPGEFPAGVGSEDYVDSLVDYFAAYFPIRADFKVTRQNFDDLFYLILTARQPGAAYTLTPNPGTSAWAITVSVQGANPTYRIRYGVRVEVFLQKAGTAGQTEDDFELIGGGQHVEADDEGVMRYDVGDLLHGYLSADTPVFSATGGQPASNSHRKYYIAYGEAWGNPIQPGLMKTDSIRQVYLGGADFEHRASGGYSLLNLAKGASVDKDRALRFGPMTRRIYTDEPAWLTFVNLRADAPSPVQLQITLTFDDDTTAEATGIQALLPFTKGEKICYPVGVSQRDLLNQVPAGKHLKEYSARLLCGSAVYSDTYRFIVDYQQLPYRRYFAYQNSLGAFDCITTYGKGSAELQRFYDQAERILPSYYSPTDAQFVDFNISRQRQFDVASGWQELSDLIRWDDFYCASVRYQVTASKAIAIGLTSKQIKQEKDGDNQFAHQFSYVPLRHDEYYSEDTEAVNETPPVIAVPVGSISLQPTVPVLTRDPTIDDSVRELSRADINSFKIAAARPNPETLGFLTPQTGALVFRRQDLPISFTELADKPNSRDGYGISDVLTASESATQATKKAILSIKNLIGFHPVARSWTGDTEPQ